MGCSGLSAAAVGCVYPRAQWVGGTLFTDNFITELSAIDKGRGVERTQVCNSHPYWLSQFLQIYNSKLL